MENDYQKMTSDERKQFHEARMDEATAEAQAKLDLYGATLRGVTEFAWNAGVCPHCIARELNGHAQGIMEALDAGDTEECPQ